MASFSSSQDDIDDIRDDINVQEALLASLVDVDSDIEERADITARLKELKARLARMQPQQPIPDWSRSYPADSGSNTNQYSSDGSSIYQPKSKTPASYLSSITTLPSRKRPFDDYDDLTDNDAQHLSKSRRSTPGLPPNSQASFSNTIGSDYDDDDFDDMYFNSNTWTADKQKQKTYLQELEERKRQEAEDAKFAKELEAQWAQEGLITPASKPNKTPSNATQSFMRPDGSWQKPQLAIPDLPPKPNVLMRSGTLTPRSDSSSEFEEISAQDWTSKYGSGPVRGFSQPIQPPQYTRRPLPGSFPAPALNQYSSTAGASVYTPPYPAPYSQYTSNPFSTQYGSSSAFGRSSTPGNPDTSWYSQVFSDRLSIPGSFNAPMDLDSYELYARQASRDYWADPEQTQEEIRDLLKHIRPDEELTEEQLREVQPDGLKIDLMAHQRKGFAWMKTMEEGTNRGGILADDMGLGKTVQALSLVLARPPPEDKKRPTLIVAPVALMQQWEREITKFVKPSHHLNVLVLHQENRNRPWNYIKTFDIVLTTYGTLGSELKRKIQWDKHVELVPNAKPKPQQELPILGERSHFHRVILDEAQNIKNRNTKGSIAACKINADYRWCLSGTPMQNNVDEIYSLIRFCRIKPYHDYEKFARDIGRPLKSAHGPKDKAMERLQALLRAVLLRRTKQSEIDGQPIIRLPPKQTIEERAIFSKDELDFYKALEAQSQIQFNKFLRKGSVGRNYSHALVLLLRLRQCCCSAQLVTNAPDFMCSATEDVDYVENAKSLSSEVIRRLDEADGYECPICMDAVENPVIFNPCGHSLCGECLTAMTEKAMDDASGKLSCPHCRAEIDIKLVTNHESFLRVYHPEREGVKPLDADEEDDESDSDSDSDSDDEIEDEDDDGEDLKDFVVDDEEEVEYDSDASESQKRPPTEGKKSLRLKSKAKSSKPTTKKSQDVKGKGKGKVGRPAKRKNKAKKRLTLADLRKEGLKSQAAKKRYLKRLGKGWLPSAKTDKTVDLLQQIRDRGEGEKTIVFSSFTTLLDLIEIPLSRSSDLTNYVRYDGSMKTQDRTNAVLRFTDDPRCTIILVSLKAGNAGLNLTAANHVILLDPFWNPFVEYQAADRCYRIGQTREVTIHRILIGDENDQGTEPDPEKDFTVEDRILKLQERKKALVETALDEKAGANFARLSTRELGYLFGVNRMEDA